MFFGLSDRIKAALINREAKKQGEEFAQQKGSAMDWIKTHKTQIGIGFAILSGALAASPWSSKATPIMGGIGAFLMGAGILPSDYHAAQAQDKK